MNTVSNVDYLPIWKKDATPEEFLMEIAIMARVHPVWFDKLVLAYESEPTKDGYSKTRYQCRNCTTTELLGLVESAKEEVHVRTRGGRIA